MSRKNWNNNLSSRFYLRGDYFHLKVLSETQKYWSEFFSDDSFSQSTRETIKIFFVCLFTGATTKSFFPVFPSSSSIAFRLLFISCTFTGAGTVLPQNFLFSRSLDLEEVSALHFFESKFFFTHSKISPNKSAVEQKY